MKDRRYLTKLLSLALTFALVFTSLGISVFAADDDENADDQAVTEAVLDEEATLDDVVFEEVDEPEAPAEDAVMAEDPVEDEGDVETVFEGEAVAKDALAETADEVAISAPQNLKATVIKQKLANGNGQRKKYLHTKNQIKLTWKAPATGKVDHYTIKCSNGKMIKSNLDADTTSVTFNAPLGSRHYTVTAFDKDGNSAAAKVKYVRGWAIKVHKTFNWIAKMDKKTTLYKKKKGSASIKKIAKGTKAIILASYPKRPKKWSKPIRVKVQLLDSDGNPTKTVGWVKRGAISASADIDLKHDYTEADKEEFANKYSSDTKYLIWVNGYTQRINIFKGSKGHWNLIGTNRVTLGNYYQPVSTGIKRLGKKVGRVNNLDDKGRPYYFLYSRTFKGSGYFHTRSYWASGKAKNSIKNNHYPNTKGCIRLYTSDAKFVYGLPKGTKIVFK